MSFYRNIRRRTAFLIGILTCCILFLCACSEVRLKVGASKDALIQVNDAILSREEGVFLLMEEKAVYENGEDPAALWGHKAGTVTLSDYVKEYVEDRLIRYTAALVMSDQLAAYPTEEEKNRAQDAAVTAWSKISGLYDVSEYGITADAVHDLYEKKAIYQAVYDSIANDAVKDVTEDSTRVMLADYVIIPSADGEETAQNIRKEVLAGTDLQEACANAGYVLLTNQTVKRGEFPQDVDSISFALLDGEMSEVIESKSGFYIIRCVEDNLLEESAANYNEILSTTKEKAFQEAWYEFSKGAKLSIDTDYWDKIDVGSIQ